MWVERISTGSAIFSHLWHSGQVNFRIGNHLNEGNFRFNQMIRKGLFIVVFTAFTVNAVTFKQVESEPTTCVLSDA